MPYATTPPDPENDAPVTCDVCGALIPAEDEYYDLPWGMAVCEDCIRDLIETFKIPGGRFI